MGAPRKYDAAEVEKEYVTGNASIRALAMKYSVSFSSMASYARTHDWSGKRIAYTSSLSRRGYEAMAASIANAQGEIRDESITVLRATLRVYAQRLAKGDVNVTTKDAVEAIRSLALLLDEPEGIKDEPRNVTGTGRSPDADFLRRAVEAARGRIDPGSVLAGVASVKPEGAKPN